MLYKGFLSNNMITEVSLTKLKKKSHGKKLISINFRIIINRINN
jgi:hypothetical protein